MSALLVLSRLVLRSSRYCVTSHRSIHVGKYFNLGSLDEIQLRSPVPLAGRKYLPGSSHPCFPKFLSGPRDAYPLLLKTKDGEEAGLPEWSKRAREVIDAAYKRYEYDGTAVAILFRGLPLKTMKDYSQWVNNLGFEPFAYKGGVTARNEIEVNVADGAHDPCEMTIEPHTEMAYSPNHPKIFTIFTLQKASWGGETAICDVRDILANVDKNFLDKVSEKGVRNTHFLHDKNSKKHFYKSWQAQFFTDNKAKVEEYLNEVGYEFEWHGENLYYWNTTPALANDPRNDEKLWFNSASVNHCSYFKEGTSVNHIEEIPDHEYATNTLYGDGESFGPGEIDKLRSVIWQNAVGFDWQNGDVLFLDQLIVQHSRLGFKGDRKVGVSLFTY